MNASAARRDAFVGRSAELATLERAFASADDGRGRIVLFSVGEPGIGKTRLSLPEFSARASARAEVLGGRCYEDPGAPAFWPWTQIVRAYARERDVDTLLRELGSGAAEVAAVVPELAARLTGLGPLPDVGEEQRRFRLFEAVTRALVQAAARRPVVVVLEDLHGADRSSLLLLQFVAREIRDARVLVVGTLRAVVRGAGHPLEATFGELVREQVSERVELGGLSAGDVAELMLQMAGSAPDPDLAASVHARTEGNPLYVTEVVRMLIARDGFADAGGPLTIPNTVRSAITRHLDLLGPEAHATLTRAALFGREFRIDVVARASGSTASRVLLHLDEAVAVRIVTAHGEPGRYRFAHALFGETLVAALGERERVELHRRAATALAADARADLLASEIAHHWFAAGPGGDAAEAVQWARKAADRALALLAFEEAAESFRRALAALDWMTADDAPARAELLLGLGAAIKRAGAVTEPAKTAFLEAAAIARALGSPELLARAALGYAPILPYGEQPTPDPTVGQLLEEAIAAWHGRDSALHARALARLAMASIFGDQSPRAACAAGAVEMARRLGDAATLRFVLAAWFESYQQRDDVDTRLEMATDLVRLADAARDLEPLAVGRLWRATHLMEVGDVGGADAEIAALARQAEEMRQPVWRWYARLMQGMRDIMAGRFAEAERASAEALAIGGPFLTFARAYFVGQMLTVRLLQGEPNPYGDEYRALFERHPDPASISPIVWSVCELGRPDEARPLLERLAADDFAVVSNGVLWMVTCMFLAEGCAALGDVGHSARVYEMLAPYRARFVQWVEGAPLGPVAHALGILARTMGCFDEAAGHFEHAIAETRRIGARPFLARDLYEYARTLQERDDPGDAARAASLLAEARPLAEAIAMNGLARRIAALDDALERAAPLVSHDGASALPVNVFRREADYWLIGYDGATIRLRDTRGVRYLVALLHHPGHEFHVTQLAGGDATTDGARAQSACADGLAMRRSIDADTVRLDARARDRYRARLRELDDELAQAERDHDLGRRERVRRERDAIQNELAAARRGGRAGTQGERARVTVTKGIGTTLDRIAAAHPKLGTHLRATVRRGYFCVYVPDPRHPIVWEH